MPTLFPLVDDEGDRALRRVGSRGATNGDEPGGYEHVAQIFETTDPGGSAVRGNTDYPPIFSELEASLGAARRWYELLRHLLWARLGDPARARPRSFEKVLNELRPQPVHALLAKRWSDVGEHLKDHRDAIAHNDPINDGATTSWTSPADGRWRVTVRLPARHRTKSRHSYSIAEGPDGLDFCHTTLCHLADVAEAVCDLEPIRTRLDDAGHA